MTSATTDSATTNRQAHSELLADLRARLDRAAQGGGAPEDHHRMDVNIPFGMIETVLGDASEGCDLPEPAGELVCFLEDIEEYSRFV